MPNANLVAKLMPTWFKSGKDSVGLKSVLSLIFIRFGLNRMVEKNNKDYTTNKWCTSDKMLYND